MIEYHSIQNILDLCKEQDKKIWERSENAIRKVQDGQE